LISLQREGESESKVGSSVSKGREEGDAGAWARKERRGSAQTGGGWVGGEREQAVEEEQAREGRQRDEEQELEEEGPSIGAGAYGRLAGVREEAGARVREERKARAEARVSVRCCRL
jgi:hypothetical protein